MSRGGGLGWALSLCVLCSALGLSPRVRAEQPLQRRFTPLSAAETGLHDATQRVVLLAPNLDARSYAELRTALAGLGVRAESVREARLDATLEACVTLSCLERVARAAKGRAALVSVTTASDRAPMLLLALVDLDGGTGQSRARVGTAGISRALLVAWQDASLALSLAGDSMLHAQSRPAGASVWLDGAPAGTTPFARQVPAGTHRLLVKLDGFVAQETAIDARPGKAERVELTLRRVPTFRLEPAPPPTAAPSVWNYVLGGALMIAALPALVGSINTLVNDGQCLQVRASDSTGCAHRADFGNQSAVTFFAGAVAFGAGSTVFFARPIP